MTGQKQKKKGPTDIPKKSKKKKGGYLWTVLAIASVILVSGIAYLSWERPPEISKESKETEAPETAPPSTTGIPQKKARPKIAIIIDDIGNSKKNDAAVLAIDAPLTLSVFPLLSDSKKIAEKAGSNGKEVMLHLPMEPHDSLKVSPGNGVLLTSMDDIAIITQLYEDIKSIPHIKGVNNHMGSKFTEDRERMRIVLKQLKDNGLFFIDSKTSPKSRSDKMAREMGIKAAARDIFLDNEQDEDYIAGQIEDLKKIARKRGSAIGIGHPHLETIIALRKAMPDLKSEFDIVPASRLVR